MSNAAFNSNSSGGGYPDWHASLDALLSLASSANPKHGAEQVARQCLARGAELLPRCALGLCVVNVEAGNQFTQIHLPEGAHSPKQDPTRLFPCFSQEVVLPLAPELPGSTFHVASNEAMLGAGSFEIELAQRLARLSGALIRHAQQLELAPDSGQLVHTLKAQLIQAEKLASLGQVIAGVVHELATPLTSIVSYSSFLKEKARRGGGDLADIERLTRITDSAERMLEFTRDLVSYARPTGRVPATVDLHQVIRRAIVFCEHELTTNQIRVQLELSATHPFVLGSHGQLTQVFVNLLTNATHAMRQTGGVLTVASELDPVNTRTVVRVTDGGVGIPSDVLPHIFDPFFTTKPEHQGTGLGLSIVREILEAHRGRVEVHSTPGEGSTFVLFFPSASTASAE